MISLHHSNYKVFLDIHTESIMEFCRKPGRKKFNIVKLDRYVNEHFGYIVSDFESLLKASPLVLKRIKDEFKYNKNDVEKALIIERLGLKTLYKHFTDNAFENTKKSIIYGSKYLAFKLDIFTCPYCNEHFTYYFDYKGGTSVRRTFDWDHFFSQDEYPFLAISFYNLVPSCKVCNYIKLNHEFDYCNPHIDFNVNEIYTFMLNPTGAQFITDTSKIQLNLVYARNKPYKNEIKNTAQTVGLLSRMRQHKEIIKDILNKKQFYPSLYLTFVNGTISKLKPKVTEVQLKRTLFGTYFNHEEYYKRPFSKLTDDILKGTSTRS